MLVQIGDLSLSAGKRAGCLSCWCHLQQACWKEKTLPFLGRSCEAWIGSHFLFPEDGFTLWKIGVENRTPSFCRAHNISALRNK
ncbi:MAG: hypothetical protein WAS90_11715 [Brachymonas denitrificans]|uniref:hypothetical protein n=1 Tax=Brachymonas denitrificans TaxID=28220 RepID=UPI00321F7E85